MVGIPGSTGYARSSLTENKETQKMLVSSISRMFFNKAWNKISFKCKYSQRNSQLKHVNSFCIIDINSSEKKTIQSGTYENCLKLGQ